MTTLEVLLIKISKKIFSDMTQGSVRFVRLNGLILLKFALEFVVSEACRTAVRIVKTQLMDVFVHKSDRTKTVEKKFDETQQNKNVSETFKMVVSWSCILKLALFHEFRLLYLLYPPSGRFWL